MKIAGLRLGLRAGFVTAVLIAAGCSAGGDSETLATAQQALTQGVPYRVRAIDYTAFQDSDTLHEGNCGTGPVDAETTSDPSTPCNIGWTKSSEWLEYSIQASSTGKFNIISRVASGPTGRTFHLSIDGTTVGGSQTVPSAGWQAFADRTLTDVSLAAGTHTLRPT